MYNIFKVILLAAIMSFAISKIASNKEKAQVNSLSIEKVEISPLAAKLKMEENRK